MSIPPDLRRSHIHWDNIRPLNVEVVRGPAETYGGRYKLTLSTRTIAEAMPDFSGYNRDAPVKVLSWKNPKP